MKPQELASMLGISSQTYTKLENGSGEITMSQVFDIAKALCISAGSLFDEDVDGLESETSQLTTQIEFTITVKSNGHADIQTDIAKRYTTAEDETKRQILRRQGLTRRRW